MPMRKPGQTTPRDIIADEAQLCFAAATCCLLIGLSGWVINRISELHMPLTSLVVVGAFYGLMGLGRLWKLKTMKPTDRPGASPGH